MKQTLLIIVLLFSSLIIFSQQKNEQLAQNIFQKEIQIYPNPTSSIFSIKNDKSVAFLRIYNIVGKEILAFEHVESQTYDISELQRGIYIVRFFDSEKDVIKVLRLNRK